RAVGVRAFRLARTRRDPGRAPGHGHVAAASRPRTAAPAADQPGRRHPAEGQVTAEPRLNDDDLHALADGRLPSERQAAVDAAIVDNADLAARVGFYRRLNAALHSGYDFMLNEPVPERLTARPRRRTRLPLARVAAVAALLAVGAAGGWLAHSMTEDYRHPAEALADLAADAYLVYSSDVSHPVEVPSQEKDHLQKWLSKRLDRPI